MNKYIKTYNVILDNMDLIRYRLKPISSIMYFQDAFARFCATKAMAAYDLFKLNQYWVVAGINMEFTCNMPFWSEEIKVEVWFSEINKLKMYVDFNILHNNQIFAKGNSLWFLIDKESKRPIKTDLIAQKFEVVNEFTLGEHKKFVLPETKEVYKKITHKNSLSDIDFNNHVNNKSYINLAQMTAPVEYRQSHILKNLSIKFNKETFLDDILTCTTNKTEINNTYTHIIEKDSVSVCDIITHWEEKKDDITILDYDLKVKSEN